MGFYTLPSAATQMLPEEVRVALGLGPEDRIELRVKGREVTLHKYASLEDIARIAQEATDIPYPGSFEAEQASAWSNYLSQRYGGPDAVHP